MKRLTLIAGGPDWRILKLEHFFVTDTRKHKDFLGINNSLLKRDL